MGAIDSNEERHDSLKGHYDANTRRILGVRDLGANRISTIPIAMRIGPVT
jgi:hypothetical protein